MALSSITAAIFAVFSTLTETVRFALASVLEAEHRLRVGMARWTISQAVAVTDGAPGDLRSVGHTLRTLRAQPPVQRIKRILLPSHPVERLLVAARLTLASVAVVGLMAIWPQGSPTSAIELASAAPAVVEPELVESTPVAPVLVAQVNTFTPTSAQPATATPQPSTPVPTSTPIPTPIPTLAPPTPITPEMILGPVTANVSAGLPGLLGLDWVNSALAAMNAPTPVPPKVVLGPVAASGSAGLPALLGLDWVNSALAAMNAPTPVPPKALLGPVTATMAANMPTLLGMDWLNSAAARGSAEEIGASVEVALVFTPTVTPTPTTIPTPDPANIEAWNADLYRPTPTLTPTPMPIIRPTVEAISVPAIKGKVWADFVPAPAEAADHYWLGRPYPNDVGNQFATPLYQFGTTGGGRYLLHHGVDMGNPYGTALIAAATGEVIHAGWDSEQVLGPYPNFYGLAVVIRLDQRLATPQGEQDVFVLYGHMSDVIVAQGQRVEAGDLIGYVGMTGIALGPHLHLEVRVGANDYISTVNPWLWMRPFPGMGTLAVRTLAADGSTWQGAKLSLIYFTSGGSKWVRTVTTYLDEELIGPDPAWGENGVMGDLSAGEYMIVGKINGERVEAKFTIQPGQTTFVELRTQLQ